MSGRWGSFDAYITTCVTLFSLAGCGGSNVAGSVSGIVASGVPVIGVTVTLTDSSGHTGLSTPTDVKGHYIISTQGLQAPFVLTAPFTEIDGTLGTLSSISDKNGDIHANLNPVTSLITQRVLSVALNGAPSVAQMSKNASNTAIAQATQDVMKALSPLTQQLGIPVASTVDPIGSSYIADPNVDKMDAMLEVARIQVRSGTVSVGVAANKSLLHVPASGLIDKPSVLTGNALTSISTLVNGATTTPIQHVIVVVAENQTFDTLFGAYQPKLGNTINNLLSKGIINVDGSPGPNFALAAQKKATSSSIYTLNPVRTSAYVNLPQPLQTGIFGGNLLPVGTSPDPRYSQPLPNGPFQISKYVPYAIAPANATLPAIVAATTATFTADPVHRFFQMWQQTDGTNISPDLFTWVATTTGQGVDTIKDGGGRASIAPPISATSPNQGGELMGFYNMSTGDAPLFKNLADNYALSDNYHQSVMGGTGVNFFSIATGDIPVYNTNGVLSVPPVNQIENPDPMPGTNNFYTQDGYQGGSYVNCSDLTQSGVSAIVSRLSSAGRSSHCESGAYYLVNNYLPSYNMNGGTAILAATNYIYPPQTVPTIGELLSANNITWKWYLGGRDAADVTTDLIYPIVLAQVSGNPALAGAPAATIQKIAFSTTQSSVVNPIGDPNLSSSRVMTGPLKSNLVGLDTFYKNVSNGTLPAVSFVVPKNLDSAHPGNSSPALTENFLNNLIKKVQASSQWGSTAIIITTDEGGGYFDSGTIQMLDFFGDGTRVPLLVVSPYAKKGYVDHVYQDHASILKFIERNWRLKPLSSRSRDGLPNPVASAKDVYMPVNGPAVGDLMSMFKF